MRYMTDNCERADHLAAEAARLMGDDNKYSRELCRLKDEFEDLNKGLYSSTGFCWRTEITLSILRFSVGTYTSREIGLHPDTIRELIKIYDRKIVEACEETEAIINKLKA